MVFTSSIYRASQRTLFCASKYILHLTKSYPVDRGFVIESKIIVINSRVSNHHSYLSNSVKTIFIPVNIISIVQQRWLVQMKIRYTPLNLVITRHIE